MMNPGRSQTIIGSELLEDKEIHKLCKILDRIIKQMSPEEQDKLEDAEVFIGYWHDYSYSHKSKTHPYQR